LPFHKSAKKRLITSKKRNLRNRDNRAQIRTAIKAFRRQAASASAEEKAQQLPKLYSLLDVQARKGVIPKKRAARLKSRLASLASS
jgi:small subunit ribosomal protein S20